MSPTTVAFEGNLAADAEITYTRAGKPIARFPVLVNRRRQDPQTGEWVDDEPTRHSCTAFGGLGTHIADSLGKGDRILVMGNLVTDSWSDRETGEKRTAQRVLVDAAGPSLRWANARPEKTNPAGDQLDRERAHADAAHADTATDQQVDQSQQTARPDPTTAGEADTSTADNQDTDAAGGSVERARRAVDELKQRTTTDHHADDNIQPGRGRAVQPASDADDSLGH